MSLGRLTIIIQTKALDRVHYALMLAASHAALDGKVHLFFGIEGVETLKVNNWPNLKTASGEGGAAYLDRLEVAGAAHPDELFSALKELDVEITACDTALSVAGMSPGSMTQSVNIEISGITSALSNGKNGQIIYV